MREGVFGRRVLTGCYRIQEPRSLGFKFALRDSVGGLCDGISRENADGHDLDTGRPHTSRSGNERGRSYARERIEDGCRPEVLKHVFDKRSREPLLVLQPAQARNSPVPLV